MKVTARLWIGIAVLIALSPLGLLLPEHFKAAGAWGEWGAGQMQQLVGYIPRGLAKLSGLWHAPLADYAFIGWGEKCLPGLSFAYIISAAIVIVVVVLLVFIIGKILSKKGD